MSKAIWCKIGISIIVLGNGIWLDRLPFISNLNRAIAQTTNPTNLPSDFNHNPMGQVTSVNQLIDVQPTDWAFAALQSLVERYGCIEGYPDRTYRGNRAITRYEFAAGLNACLNQIQQLIAATGNPTTTNNISETDLATIRRLQEQFAAELATLRGRLDGLEKRTAALEAHQFSTTTKLSGEVITYLADAFGKDADSFNNTIVNYRARLTFDTSFTGKDHLRVRLQAANLQLLNAGNPNIDNSTGGFGAPPTFASTYPSAFSDETRLLPSPASEGENNSQFRLHLLSYDFPIGDRLNIFTAAGVTDPTFLGADPISPFTDSATGAISNFANSNPVYYPLGNRAGLGFNYKISNLLTIAGGYVGQDVGGLGGPNSPGRTSGIFSGGYSAFGQMTLYAGNLTAGLLYLNTYTPKYGIDTLAGSNAAKVSSGNLNLLDDSSLENPDDRVSANHYGLIMNYRLSPRFQLGGWVGYSNARVLGVTGDGTPTGNKGDVNVLNYAVTLAFPDLGAKGNLGGIVLGMQPRVTGTSNSRVAQAIGLPDGQRSDRDTGFHIEAFYRFQVNDNISITPGVFWLTAPNHDARNEDAIIGVLRTSFVF